MWFLTDPEELKNYSYKKSLKKAKESLVQRYLSFINEEMLEPFSSQNLWSVFQDNLWYIGISSNPLLSLTAHDVDLNKSSILSIDPTGFTPLKYIPNCPAQFLVWGTNGNCTSQNIETKGSYDLYFNARTSQSGYVYQYLPGEGSCFMRFCCTFCGFIKSREERSGSMFKRSWPLTICSSKTGEFATTEITEKPFA